MNLESLLKIIITTTYVEVGIIAVSILFLVFLRLYIVVKKKKEAKIREELSSFFLTAIEEERKVLEVKKCKNINILLSVIEELSSKFSESYWVELKNYLIKKYLLPKARKWSSNSNWLKRDFAARSFALLPLIEDEKFIMKLLEDKILLIRMAAIFSTVSLGTIPLLTALFQKMSEEPEMGRYAYRDAILNGPVFIFSWIREQLKMERKPKLRSIYLDILSAKFDSSVLLYIGKDLQSDDDELRLKAVKVVANFPSEESIKLILPYLKDSSGLIRAEVIKVLPLFLGEKSIPDLKMAFNDKEWWVRLQAALSLRRLGDEGKKILEESKESVAKYVLSLSEVGLGE